MLLLVTNLWFSGTCGRARHDEGGSCGCAKLQIFFVSQFVSNVSNHYRKCQLTVVVGGTNSQWTIPFTTKRIMSMLFVEHRTRRAFCDLVIVGSSIATILASFLDHNRKTKFRHPLWSKSWAETFVSRSCAYMETAYLDSRRGSPSSNTVNRRKNTCRLAVAKKTNQIPVARPLVRLDLTRPLTQWWPTSQATAAGVN
jgi:hypothetical protein